MKIENVVRPPYEVEDWGFFFLNADPFEVTLDLDAGDTCQYTPGDPVAVIRTVEKPSYVGGDPIPAEVTVVPTRDAIVKTRRRMMEAPPLEVVEEWQRLLEELGTPEKAN